MHCPRLHVQPAAALDCTRGLQFVGAPPELSPFRAPDIQYAEELLSIDKTRCCLSDPSMLHCPKRQVASTPYQDTLAVVNAFLDQSNPTRCHISLSGIVSVQLGQCLGSARRCSQCTPFRPQPSVMHKPRSSVLHPHSLHPCVMTVLRHTMVRRGSRGHQCRGQGRTRHEEPSRRHLCRDRS
jgi:hypothetical protein